MSIWLVLLLPFAWASHTLNYLPYCYNLSLTPSTTSESYPACLKGNDGMAVMTKIYVQNASLVDGAGSVSAAYKAECCLIDAGVMPNGWVTAPSVSASFTSNTDVLCANGYFLNGLTIKAQDGLWNDKTSMWKQIGCIKPTNLNFGYQATVNVNFRDAFLTGAPTPTFIGCPNGSYILGFHTVSTTANNSNTGDLLDIEYLKCGFPYDGTCPALSLANNMVALGNSSCTHQFCTRTLTCASGYYPNIDPMSSILWNPSLSRYTMSSFSESYYRRDPRLVSYPIVRPTEEQLANYTFGSLYAWSPSSEQGFLEIDLGVARGVTGVVTLGGCGDPMWRSCKESFVRNYFLYYTNGTDPAATIIGSQNGTLVTANTDGFTRVVYPVNITARRFILNTLNYSAHVYLRADLYVKPLPYIMIKDATAYANAPCNKTVNALTTIAPACDGRKYTCTFFFNSTVFFPSCLAFPPGNLTVDWFYNGVPQPQFIVVNPAMQNITINVGNYNSTTSTNLTCQLDQVAWTGVNLTCDDMNECQRKCNGGETPGVAECHNCDELISSCNNTDGSFVCNCFPGYTLQNGTCVNINECAHSCTLYETPFFNQCNNCSSDSTVCQDTNGSFTCPCKPGFAVSGSSCVPVNECNVTCDGSNGGYCNNCFNKSFCTDTNTTFYCTCPPGYTGSGVFCSDINECLTTANCPANSDCVNTPGNYTCNCSAGYLNNGTACDDINECNVGSPCGLGPCENLPGSFRCPPYISSVRWKLVGSSNWTFGPLAPTGMNLTSLAQSPSRDQVEINITNMGANFSFPLAYFWYGSPEFPLDFATQPCQNSTVTSYVCNMSAGAGRNLTFSLYFCGPLQCNYWQAPAFRFMYPSPTLTPSTLRLTDASSGTNSLTTSSLFGVNVWMDGTNFFPSVGSTTQLSVQFGTHSCALVQSNSTTLQCSTGPFSEANLTFTITVGRGSSAQVFQGSNNISFVAANNASNASCPLFPTIVNVSGCTPGNSSQITDCATQGGTLLQVTADVALIPPVLVFVGGNACPVGNLSPDNRTVSCVLPAGQGQGVGVVLGHATPAVFSLTSYVVSYSGPSIASISSPSCTSNDSFTLVSCSLLDSGTSLSIFGQNFGASGAQVITGGVTYNATHDPAYPGQLLTIPFPPWRSGVTPLVVFARSGLNTRGVSATYSFATCSPGFFGTNTCAFCAAGRFTNASGQPWCTLCNPGTFQPNLGKSFCVPCDPGSFNPNMGSSNCSQCSAGTFANAMASTCTSCVPGKYSLPQAVACSDCMPGWAQPLAGMSVCAKCPLGSFSGASGQSSCTPCYPGTRSVGVGQVSCEACPAGRYQPTPGSQDCLFCGPGTYSGTQAQRCLQCPPGTVSANNGTVSCTPCDPGMYQDQGGMLGCLICDNGTYAANSGQVGCNYCPPGRATSLTKQISCQGCLPGEFQSEAGATSCEQCDAGKYSDKPNMVACQACKAGEAQMSQGQTKCVPCDAGTFRGVFQPECEDCSPGFYQTAKGQASCIPCPAGWFSNSTSECIQCPPGTISIGSATTCTECARGYYGLPLSGQTVCFPCSVGKYSNDTAITNCTECPAGTFAGKVAANECVDCDSGKFSTAEARTCTSCFEGRYAAGLTLDDCLACPAGATTAKEAPYCRCAAGEYGIESKNSKDQVVYSCFENPLGTRTDLAGLTQSQLVTLAGYWRSSNATLTYYRCYAPQFCLGGLNSDCASFREGPMCALCKPGYKSAGSTRACVACPEVVARSWGITIGILLAVGIALIVAYWLILKMADAQQREMLQKHKKSQEAAMAAMAETAKVGDEYFEQLRAEIQDKEVEDEQEVAKEEEEVITYGQRRAPNFMYKIKIVVSFYQIASLLPAQGGIHWPQQFVDFINFFSFLNFDFIPWQNISCAVTIDYYTKILIVGLLPIGLVGALAAFFSLSLVYYGRNDSLSDQMAKQNRVLRAKRQFTKCVLFTIFLLYPFVSRTALGVYNCVTVEGVRYLAADFALLCDSPDWSVAAGYTSVFVLLYPIGTPLIYFVLMKRADRRSPDAFLELGFLYEAYVDDRWYWELLDMGHKLILTSIVVFLPSEMIMGANMVIMVLYLILLLVCHPYLRKGDDRLHLLGQVNLFVLALMGHALRSLDDPFESPLASRSAVEALLAAMLILINGIFLLSFLIIAGRNVKKAIVDYRQKRLQLLKEAPAQPSSSPPSARPSAQQEPGAAQG